MIIMMMPHSGATESWSPAVTVTVPAVVDAALTVRGSDPGFT